MIDAMEEKKTSEAIRRVESAGGIVDQREGLSFYYMGDKVVFKQGGGGGGWRHVNRLRKDFQAEKMVSAKALRQEHACHVGEIARSSGGQEGEVVTGGKVNDKMDHLVMLSS